MNDGAIDLPYRLILKISCRLKYSKVQHHYSLNNALQRIKPTARLIFEAPNFPKATQFLTNTYYLVLLNDLHTLLHAFCSV